MALRLHSRVITNALDVQGEALPTKFRIFSAGVNTTRKGPFVYDAEAAAEVMAEYQAGGVQLCLDLEHDSLDPKKREARADAADAMGWYDLEQNSDGSLWAVNVRWSSEGERRLRGKLQRYTSPAFFTTEEDGTERPRRLINIALCAMPATLDAAPLVAATEGILARLLSSANPQKRPSVMKPKKKPVPATSVKLSMSAEEAKQAVDVISKGDGNAALALVTQLLQSAASGGDASTDAPPADDEGAPELSDPPVPPAPGDDPTKKPDTAAALSLLATLTGCASVDEAVESFRTMRETADRVKADTTALDLSSRRELVGKLVKLGYETPASAWEGKPEDRKPRARFMSEPLAELRERVTQFEARPLATPSAPVTGGGTSPGKVITLSDGNAVALSASEVQACTEAGAKLEEYAANKAIREAARSSRKK